MAVYTHLASHEIEAMLALYDVGELASALGIAEGVENSNYLLVTEQEGSERKYILTIFEKRMDEEQLPFYLGLMEHLAARDIPCPLPVPQRNGDIICRTPDGKPAVLVTFLTGRSIRQVQNVHVRELGEMMARMHQTAKEYSGKRSNNLSLAGWRKLFEKTAQEADRCHAGLKSIIEDELHYLMDAWPSPAALPSGVVHADMFPDNVFFREGRLSGVIDFYFACNDSWMYDLSIAINAWCFESDGSFNVTKARHLLAGYQSVRRLTPQECKYLPVLARGAALRFLLTRLHDWLFTVEGAVVTVKDPIEYLRKLQFHQSIKGYAAYGL